MSFELDMPIDKAKGVFGLGERHLLVVEMRVDGDERKKIKFERC